MAIPNWLTLSTESGNSGTSVVVVTADTNTTLNQRVYAFTVRTDNTGRQKQVQIIQNASGADDYSMDYLTLEIISGGTIHLGNHPLYYSKNGEDWVFLNSGGTINVSVGDEVEWKGDGASGAAAGDDVAIFHKNSTAYFNAYGNIASLKLMDDYQSAVGTDCDKLYGNVFVKVNLVDAGDVILPYTGFTDTDDREGVYTCGYPDMFKGCSKLIKAPTLPATKLTECCYMDMFSGCTSLTEAPDLPATELARACYYGMFRGCTSLETAPVISATTLANDSLNSMFVGCTSLQKAPVLNSVLLTDSCYYHLFSACTNINYIKCNAKNISATSATTSWVANVAPFGYFIKPSSMNDWEIDSIDGIPIGWTPKDINNYVIADPEVLVTYRNPSSYTINIESSGGWTASTTDYWITLSNSTGVLEGELRVTTSENITDSPRTGYISVTNGSDTFIITVYNYNRNLDEYLTFKVNSDGDIIYRETNQNPLYYSINDGEWTSIASSTTLSVQTGDVIRWKGTGIHHQYAGCEGCYVSVWSGTTAGIEVYGNPMSISLENFATDYDCGTLENLFNGCNGVESVKNLILPTELTNGFQGMFYGCTNLTDTPLLPATTMVKEAYMGMFANTAIVNPPELPAKILADSCYRAMFEGCTELTTAPVLPAMRLEKLCYDNMFAGCESLEKAPVLAAHIIEADSYNDMFANCSNLDYIKCLAISGFDETANWVTNVAPIGVFVKDVRATGWTVDSDSGIPIGWTVMSASTNEKYFIVSESAFTVTGAEKRLIVKVVSSSNWDYFENNNWINCTKDDSNLIIDLDENSSGSDRVGTITVSNTQNSSINIVITQSTVDYNSENFTIRMLSDGNLSSSGTSNKTIEWCVNNGEWITGSSADIDVVSGDVVEFKSANKDYTFGWTFNVTGLYKVFGNIMSLQGDATYLNNYQFQRLFEGNTGLTTAENLILPDFTANNCYQYMFSGCTSLTTAPAISNLSSRSCALEMFAGCSSLNYIKCTATSFGQTAIVRWVQDVAPTGTFVKASGVMWEINSINGIPIGWTNIQQQYFSFDIISAGTITWIKSNAIASDRTIEYSKNNGSTWNSITSSRDGVSFSVNSGDKVIFRGSNAHYATSNLNYSYFQTTCKFKINGNIMSLLYGDNFATQNILPSGSTFCCFFVNNTGLTDVENLDLIATTIKDSCYEGMFSGCTSLAKAPTILPSTTMEYECYENMFGGCTSLQKAPILPATSLSNSCYSGMFDGCSSLNYIKALFTTEPGTTYTSNWVRNVAASGTFVKNRSAGWTTTGNNGIPNGWTVQEV